MPESVFKPCPTCGVTINGWARILHETTDDDGRFVELVPMGFQLEPCGHRIFGEEYTLGEPVAATEVHELEAIAAGLSPGQEIRRHALSLAVDLMADTDWAVVGDQDSVDVAIEHARRLAAWIADGDPAPVQDAASEGSVSAVEATEPAEAPRVPLRVCQDRERPHGPHRSQFGAFGVQDCPGRSEDPAVTA